jgi:hypothetical protein
VAEAEAEAVAGLQWAGVFHARKIIFYQRYYYY